MQRENIPIYQFLARTFDLFDRQWLLLTCGDFAARDFNCMTISWGSLGVMWNRPFAQTVVWPHRYTFQFMEKYPTFTLCAFPEEYRQALNLLGSNSGRDGNKIAEAGLTPVAATVVAAPALPTWVGEGTLATSIPENMRPFSPPHQATAPSSESNLNANRVCWARWPQPSATWVE